MLQRVCTCLTEDLLSQVRAATEGRNYMKARAVVKRLGWDYTHRNITLAGMALRFLGWEPDNGNEKAGNYRLWRRPEQ